MNNNYYDEKINNLNGYNQGINNMDYKYDKFQTIKQPEIVSIDEGKLLDQTAQDIMDENVEGGILDPRTSIASPLTDSDYVDDETWELISAFCSAEMQYKTELFNSKRIRDFHEAIREVFTAQALADLGKEKIKMIEEGKVPLEELEYVEAEIIILFTQIMRLRLDKNKTYERENKPINPSLTIPIVNPEYINNEKKEEELNLDGPIYDPGPEGPKRPEINYTQGGRMVLEEEQELTR
ncbi:MAG: hypothetical protein IKR57_06210 [Bacilli bacterium]|nr:hypothetical protein [Bacilli bacterium]